MSTSPRIETIDLRSISYADARAAATLICSVWPKPGRTVDTLTEEIRTRWAAYAGPEAQFPRAFFIREGGELLAHASAMPRTVATSQGELTVLALARVCTAAAARGRQLGVAVAKAALQLVDDGVFPFALFQTSESVRPFYDRLGAVPVHNRFVNSLADDPTASPFWDRFIMRYPARAGWPEGEIDLRGPGW